MTRCTTLAKWKDVNKSAVETDKTILFSQYSCAIGQK